MACDISILVPCYNVENYLRECLGSIVNQTHKNIEIICINDGSTDSTLEIIREYAKSDTRIKIVDKKNSGYGDSMNRGLEIATGEYIGIVESDDYIELDMFEKLFNAVKKFDADISKSNFTLFWTSPDFKEEVFEFFKKHECGKPILPHKYQPFIFRRKPSIWSAIYRRAFLKKNKISFLNTPGASFQDTSFAFKAFAKANKVVPIYDALLHYRQDNVNSSVNNLDKKYMYVIEEYDEIQKMIEKDFKEVDVLAKLKASMFYDTCMWAFERLSPNCRYKFLEMLSPKFKEIDETIGIEKLFFEQTKWKYDHMKSIMNAPFSYLDFRYTVDNAFIKRLVINYNNVIQTPAQQKPFFTIVVSVYNIELYLRSCLDSIINQSFSNVEIICVNDGSTDGSLEILQQYAKLDARIKIIDKENGGISSVRNVGMQAAKGEYIWPIDGDDYIDINACEILHARIKDRSETLDVIVFGATPFSKDKVQPDWFVGTLATPDKFYNYITQDILFASRYFNVFPWRLCLRAKNIHENNIYFNESLRYGEDAIYGIDLFEHSKNILSISDKLYNYRYARDGSLMEIEKNNKNERIKKLLHIVDITTSKTNGCNEIILRYLLDYTYSAYNECTIKAYAAKRMITALSKINAFSYMHRLSSKFSNYCIELFNRSKTVDHFLPACTSTGKVIFTGKHEGKCVPLFKLIVPKNDWFSAYFVIDILIIEMGKKIATSTLGINLSMIKGSECAELVINNMDWRIFDKSCAKNIFYIARNNEVIIYSNALGQNSAVSWNVRNIQSRDLFYPFVKRLGNITAIDCLKKPPDAKSIKQFELLKKVKYAQNKILEYEFLAEEEEK